jgi:hypothetical protein
MLAAYLSLNFNDLDVFAVGFAVAGATAFWIETARVWIKRPVT